MYPSAVVGEICRNSAKTILTAGLKCAPEIGPSSEISTNNIASGQSIPHQRNRVVRRERIGHDARSDNGADKRGCSEKL
ncbi:MAG: hypothetical protein JWS11_101, partial [Cypionkella sp.]|nr:hypothetical protein [Cypionkella sp.]